MEASAKHRWGSSSLAGKRVAVQGCGGTGYYLAKKLHQAGASLVATDIDEARLQRVVQEFNATPVAPNAIYEAEVDIFAPCALGGVINDETVNLLKSEMVVGSANNQLLADEHGEALIRRGILFAPDCVANSGGMINGCRDLLGWDVAQVERKIDEIYDRTLNILEVSEKEQLPPNQTADRLARSLISLGHSSKTLL
jgi:leucine dehydrogenase